MELGASRLCQVNRRNKGWRLHNTLVNKAHAKTIPQGAFSIGGESSVNRLVAYARAPLSKGP